MKRILFVCMGNICRSPTAEGVFRVTVEREAPQLDLYIDSAGTHDYHVGYAPDRRAQAAALARGVNLGALRARQVCAEDFAAFDLILAMDSANLEALKRRCPVELHHKLRLFLEFAPALGRTEVPDPYYGGGRGFEDVLDLAETAAEGLLAEMLVPAEYGGE